MRRIESWDRRACAVGLRARRRARKASAVGLAVAVGLATTAAAQTPDYRLTAPVVAGQSADPVPGAFFAFFDWSPAISDDGLLAFSADLDGGDEGIFSLAGTTLSLVALRDQSAGGTAGMDFCFFDLPPTLNDQAEIAFPARISAGCVGFGTEGLFLASPTAAALVVTGDAAPVAGGPGFCTFTRGDVNSSSEVSFSGSYDGGSGCFATRPTALFIATLQGTRTVLSAGGTAPGTGGGRFWAFPEPPSLNDAGDLGFLADVDTSSGGAANVVRGVFYLPAGGSAERIAFPGDLTDEGAAFTEFFDGAVALGSAGGVAFNAELGGGITGVFHKPGASTATALALERDPVPGCAACLFTSFPQPPVLNDAGDIAFFATYEDTQNATFTGVFVHRNDALWPVAVEGSPLTAGVIDEVRATAPTVNADGDIALVAQLDTGGASPVPAIIVALLPEPAAAFQQLTALAALMLYRRSRTRGGTP